jgi:hypothetical protein
MKKKILVIEKNRNPIVRYTHARTKTMAKVLQKAGSSLIPEVGILNLINRLESYAEDIVYNHV